MTARPPSLPSHAPRRVYRHSELKRVLDPQSLAIVGASPNPDSFGASTRENLKHFAGTVYLVNPKYDQIGGERCYPSVTALPTTPDCVVLTVGREWVEPVVLECAERDVGGVVIFASGYSETGRPERIAQQKSLAAIAGSSGLRIVGPNCIGVMNYGSSLPLTFARGVEVPRPGPVAVGLASQSGAMGHAVAQASHMGLSFSHLLAAGNSCDVDTADYVAYLAEDPTCSVIVCIFEGLPDPWRLIEAAEIAKSQDKPLIVYKVATGEGGAAAALSHTGVLAGSNAAYQAAFERMEAVVVTEYEAIAETAAFFAKAKRPRGPGVGVVAGSGGFCVLSVDVAQSLGVPLPPPGEAVRAALRPLVPEFGVAGNPCDVTAQNTPDTFGQACSAFLADPQYGAVVLPYGFTYAGEAKIRRLLGMHEAAKKHDKIACLPWSTAWAGGPGAVEAWSCSHLAVFGSIERCFKALASWYKREGQFAERAGLASTRRQSDPTAMAPVDAALKAQSGRIVTESAAKQILSGYGVPVVRELLVTSADEAARAARELSYPVVLKLESPDLPHKTDAGVVRLSLKDEAAVRSAYVDITAIAQAMSPRPIITGMLVQPMISGGLELMIGTNTDPSFGPLVVVGMGGIFVELLRDTAVDLAPVNPARARKLLDRLKARRLLEGYRGSAPVDTDKLIDVICRLSEFAADHRDTVAEVDVNPLICSDRGVFAVDALIVKHS